MTNEQIIGELINKSRVALKELEKYTQEQVDALVKAAALAVKENAEILAKEVIEETGLGKYEDKIDKNSGTPDALWNYLKDKKSVGIIKREPENGLLYVAKPKGIIAVVAPTTNPTITALCNGIYAIKGRNTAIIAPHPRAKKTTKHTVDIMNAALKKLNAPENIIQIIEEPSIQLTQELMKTADAIVATGGMGMVKSAYSSGKPAYGVGAGNVQTILDRDFDYEKAAAQIVAGRIFDNGLICAGNQSVIMPIEKKDEIIKALVKNGVYYTEDPVEIKKFRETLFVDGHINREVVGQSAMAIGKLACIDLPEGTKAILLKVDKVGQEEVLCGEKMCPVMVAITYNTFIDAVDIAKKNLLYEGAGHSTVIHSNDQKHIEYVGNTLPISRLIVNQPGIAAAGTNFMNGFNPTTTLGCGSWGNNSISENLTYEHLINISRIGYMKDCSKIPTQEQIWK